MTSEVGNRGACGNSHDRRLARSLLERLWRTSMLATATVFGTTTAFSSPEVPPKWRYSVCSRIVDLLYDLTGDPEADRRQLGVNFSQRPQFWNYLYEHRIANLIGHNKNAAKSLARPGAINDVLDVYLAADKTREECERSGCSLTISYQDEVSYFYEEGVKIDRSSTVSASIPDENAYDLLSGLGLTLSGGQKSVSIWGQAELVTITQTGVIMPCPDPSQSRAKCEDILGYLPQKEMPVHEDFQTVMMDRFATTPRQSAEDCREGDPQK